MLNEYHIKFLQHLAHHRVAFLIIGGQARWLLDLNHQTRDLDVWVRIEQQDIPDLERALVSWAREHPQHAVMQNLSSPPLQLRPNVQIKLPEVDGVWFLDRFREAREIGIADGIDVLTSQRGWNFDDCMSRSRKHDVEGVEVLSLDTVDLDEGARRLSAP